jgi:hypothetical protein
MHCQEGQYVSSNDAVSSLVWLLMCYLRKRPLPGQARPAALQVCTRLSCTSLLGFQTQNVGSVACACACCSCLSC